MAYTNEDLNRLPILVATRDGKIIKAVIPHALQVGISGRSETAVTEIRQGVAVERRLVSESPAAVRKSDFVIEVSASTSKYDSVTNRFYIDLPANPEFGQIVIIKDTGATAQTVIPVIRPYGGATVDGSTSLSLSENYAGYGLMWTGGEWTKLFSALGGGGGGSGSGDPNASYVVIGLTGSLPNERFLSASTGLQLTDGGAGGAIAIALTDTLVSPGYYQNANVTVDQQGRISSIANGTVYTGSYAWVMNHDTGSITSVYSVATSSWASVPGLTASLTTVGAPVLLQANVLWRPTTAGQTAAWFTFYRDGLNIGHPLSGCMGVQGDGSVTELQNASFSMVDYPAAGAHTYAIAARRHTDLEGGQIVDNLNTIAAFELLVGGAGSGGGGGGDAAPTYLVLSATGSLPNERVLSVSGTSGLILSDAGAGGNASLAVDNNVVATVSGTTFSGLVKFSAGASGTLTATGVSAGAVVFGGTLGVLTGAHEYLNWDQASYKMLGVGKAPNFITSSQFGQRAGVDVSGSIAFSFSRNNEKNSLYATTNGTVAGLFEYERVGNWGMFSRHWVSRMFNGGKEQNAWKAAVFDDPTGFPNQNTHLTINYLNHVGSPYTGLVSEAVVYIGAGSGSLGDSGNTRPSLWAVNDVWLASVRGNVGIGTTSPQDKFSVVGNTSFTGSVNPGTTTTYDFGSTSKLWRNIFATGFSGSLTTHADGKSAFVAGGGVTITTASNGQVFISSAVSGDSAASYLVLGATASLANERVFTPGTGLLATDAGAGGAYTVGINNNVVATVSGTTFTSTVSGTLFQAPQLMTTRASTSSSFAKSFAVAESGRLVVTRDMDPNVAKTIQIVAGNGAAAFDVWFIAGESGFSVAKKYSVAFQYNADPIVNKIVDTGPYMGFDIYVAWSKPSAAILNCTFYQTYPAQKNIAITFDFAATSLNSGGTTVTFSA